MEWVSCTMMPSLFWAVTVIVFVPVKDQVNWISSWKLPVCVTGLRSVAYQVYVMGSVAVTGWTFARKV